MPGMNTNSGNSEGGIPAPAPASAAVPQSAPAARQQELPAAAQSPVETPRRGFSIDIVRAWWYRMSPGARTAAPWVLLFLGLAFAGWAVVHYLTVQYQEEKAPSATSIPGEETILTPPAPGMVSIRVAVRVHVAGKQAPIGTMLPRQVALQMLGKNDQPYEARFDRAGVWGMEAPPGVYRVSGVQKALGEWSWEMSGDCVRPSKDRKYRYDVTLDLARPHSTFDLVLK